LKAKPAGARFILLVEKDAIFLLSPSILLLQSQTSITAAAAAGAAISRAASVCFTLLMKSTPFAIAAVTTGRHLPLLDAVTFIIIRPAAAAAAAATLRPFGARFILVVEKDAIFQRLVEDRLFEALPCILITGRGMPDIASRWGLPYRAQVACHPGCINGCRMQCF
jgi:hypothetical protein